MNAFCGRCGAGFDPGDQFCAKCGTPRQASPGAPPPAAAGSGVVTVTPQPPKKSLAAVIVATSVLPVVGMGAFFAFSGGMSGDTEGSMSVSGGPHGTFTFTPTDCHSMQPYGRFGANLHGDGHNDGAVYVTMDPIRGPAVEIEVPGSCRNADGTDCTVFSVPRERCSVFQSSVEFNGVVVNDVRMVEGNVRLECALEDGTSIRGAITFDGC